MVPVRDFDPAKDAARIDTAIKTKGERVQQLNGSDSEARGRDLTLSPGRFLEDAEFK